jgi:hypothetical protein
LITSSTGDTSERITLHDKTAVLAREQQQNIGWVNKEKHFSKQKMTSRKKQVKE